MRLKNNAVYLLCCMVWAGLSLKGQVACGYAFSYTNNIAYTPLPVTAPTLLLASGAANPSDPETPSPTDEDFFPSQPIGFPFVFNGITYTKIGVATNGWVWFGENAPVKAAGVILPFTNVLSSDFPIEGIVSALNGDLEGRWTAGLATIRTRTGGTAPNRSFTIEWNNFKSLDDGEGTGYCGENRNRFDFQIILEENGNRISFAYNAAGYCWQGYNQLFQVGLRGASKGDVHTRSIPAGNRAWEESQLGLSNATAVIRSSSPVTMPAANARFTFFPSTPAQLTWLGLNSNWQDPVNWTGGKVPMRCNDVVIPSGKSYYPELAGNKPAESRSLRIETGAALTLKNDYQSFLSVYGNLYNDGTIINNTNSYLTLAGGGHQRIGGEGHFFGTDLYITANSQYTLQNDLVIRNLYINGGSALALGDKILDVYSILQEGRIDQGTGVLVIEGGPSSVQLSDSTFEARNGTTFFGNGELWDARHDQVVPSLHYNHLWIRTNKPHMVQLGTDRDFSCNNLLFYNPGEPGGQARTARNITVNGDLRLGIDSLPGTELVLNHTIHRSNGDGKFRMGRQDRLNISHTSVNQQPALSGFGTPVFSGNVTYTSNSRQTLVRGTYANLSINGTGERVIEGKVNLRGILKISEGTLRTGDSLTLRSDSSATALISGAGNGRLEGSVEMERYIQGTGEQQVLISSAMQHLVLRDYADDFPVLGPDGVQLINNALPTVWEYRETVPQPGFATGWYSRTQLQHTLEGGESLLARISGGTTFNTRGMVNSGLQKIPLSSTAGNNDKKGLNLVGNPYPSPIDWNLIAQGLPASVSRSMSKMGSGNRFNGHYATWLPLGSDEGLGINGATRYIGSQEGFFVRAFSADTLRLGNQHRAEVLNTRSVTVPETVPYIRLGLQAGDKTDETLVYFSQNGNNTQALDGNDAVKYPSQGELSCWYSLKDSVKLAIQGRRKSDQPDSIPLGIEVNQTGTYQLRLTEILHFPATAMVYLEDRVSNTFQNLRREPSYSVNLNKGTVHDRFRIHFRPGVTMSAYKESCSGGDGRVRFNNPTSTRWDIAVYNSNDSLVNEKPNMTGNWEIAGLPADEYRAHYVLSGQGLELDEWITVQAGSRLEASFTASVSEVKDLEQEVEFTSTTPDAEGLFWNFGDGMMASGEETVSHVFTQAGTYQVVLTATREECADTASMMIHVLNVTGIEEAATDKTTFTIYPNPASVTAYLQLKTEKPLEDASLYVVDMNGKIVREQPYRRIEPGSLLELPVSGLSKGNYEVIVGGKGFRTVSRLVVAGK